MSDAVFEMQQARIAELEARVAELEAKLAAFSAKPVAWRVRYGSQESSAWAPMFIPLLTEEDLLPYTGPMPTTKEETP